MLKNNEIQDIFTDYKKYLEKSVTPLKRANRILLYMMIIVFLLVGGMVAWLVFNNSVTENQKLKTQFLDEVSNLLHYLYLLQRVLILF